MTMQTWIKTRTTGAKLWFGLATLCLFLSIFALSQEAIGEYNKAASRDQFDQRMTANGTQMAVDDWGIDYRLRYRHLITVLCIAGFGLSCWRRSARFAVIPYLIAVPLIYLWITITVQEISYNPLYMAESPYLLLIANPFDWVLFIALGFTIIIMVALLVKSTQLLPDES